jgi:monofunctional glycosyltransferase
MVTPTRRPRRLVRLCAVAGLCVFAAIATSVYLVRRIPDVAWLRTENPTRTAMMQRRVRQPADPTTETLSHWQPISEISPDLVRSIIAAEDNLYFQHQGFDWEALWGALLLDLQQGRIAKGGSSITQQVAKNLFLDPSRTVFRKLQELFITYRLERDLSKLRILEIYLNVAEFGSGLYGVGAAAQSYFGKTAGQLNLAESIRLSSILPDPTHAKLQQISPELLSRQVEIAAALREHGWVSASTHEVVIKELRQHQKIPEPRISSVGAPAETDERLRDPLMWMSRGEEFDRVLMTPDAIAQFNEQTLIRSGGFDHLQAGQVVKRPELVHKILEVAGLSSIPSALTFDAFRNSSPASLLRDFLEVVPWEGGWSPVPLKYDRSNNALTRRFYLDLLHAMNLEVVTDQVIPTFALTTRRADIVAWPVDALIMSKPADPEFNWLQQTSLHTGSPVTAFHRSRHGSWIFVRTAYVDGWVKETDLAWAPLEQVKEFQAEPTLVVTAPQVRTDEGIVLDASTRLPLLGHSGRALEAKLPIRGDRGELTFARVTVPEQAVAVGFPAYTRRHVIEQAFRLLDQPYSWGGRQHGWDCSSFVQDTFGIFGIRLPRNSVAQMEIARRSYHRESPERERHLPENRLDPGITLLGLPGHIMLYLGQFDGKPHAIHALWAVTGSGDALIKVNKVSVTGLDIGAGSTKGSLLERIETIGTVELGRVSLAASIEGFLKWLAQHRKGILIVSLLLAVVMLSTAWMVTARRLIADRRARRTGELP